MIGYIYITTNLINNKKYIGKKESSKFIPDYLGSGKLIKRAVKKYGPENFNVKILKECNSIKELNDSERYYIKLHNAQKSNNYYNISEGGDWGDISKGLSEEKYKQWGSKIRQHHLGSHHSEETKKKMSESRKKYITEHGFSEETRKKMSKSHSGEKCVRYGTHISEYQKQRIKEALSKKVTVCFKDGKIKTFDSVKSCIKYMKDNYNISSYLVKRLLKDKTPLNLPEKERNRYPHVYELNGMKIYYDK